MREKYGLNRSDITHEAFSDNFAALCDRNKRGRLGIMNKSLKIDGLLDIHNRENDCPLLVGVSADGVVKGCAVIEILCDEIADRLRIVGDNRKNLFSFIRSIVLSISSVFAIRPRTEQSPVKVSKIRKARMTTMRSVTSRAVEIFIVEYF